MTYVVVCNPLEKNLSKIDKSHKGVLLYNRPKLKGFNFCGAQIKDYVKKQKTKIDPVAWDFLSIAMSVIAADTIALRDNSPDGWTRQIHLKVAVSDQNAWVPQATLLQQILQFLTSDLWTIEFEDGGEAPPIVANAVDGVEDSVVLLSGGLDSLIGTIDLVKNGKFPLVVSQIVKGDREKQTEFSEKAGGLRHYQFTNSLNTVGKAEKSQRARSILFFAYGILSACSLKKYQDGSNVDLFVCENGFISINPPLTGARLGSLSTRTTHPIYIARLHRLLSDLGIRVTLKNPYSLKTKGEMLSDCLDQRLLSSLACKSTSCGRFLLNGYKHCGRCVPCLIRRAAFKKWGKADRTGYVYSNLGLKDVQHSKFDDVRSVAMAIGQVKSEGVASLSGASLISPILDDPMQFEDVVRRGLLEVESLLSRYKVK